MKRITIILIVFFAISSLSSCNKKNELKTYTCDCVVKQKDNGVLVQESQTTYETSEIEESEAKEECELSVYQYAGTPQDGIEQTVTCSVR